MVLLLFSIMVNSQGPTVRIPEFKSPEFNPSSASNSCVFLGKILNLSLSQFFNCQREFAVYLARLL